MSALPTEFERTDIGEIQIAPEVLEDGDVEIVQDLVMAAFSDGLEKIREAISSEMGSMAGGFIPNGFDLSNLSGLMGN